MTHNAPVASPPLAGLRVLDVGSRISAPFCAGLLGELGAEVIKIEPPGTGEFLRSVGPFLDGYSLWWAVEGRGRKSVTCDLHKPEGQALFRRLAAVADVVVENFRPGTMEKWGIGPGDLSARLVFIRISAFGQDGPYAGRPGLDRVGSAFGGLLNLTGYPGTPPVRPGINLSDYLTGVFAAAAAIAALYRRDATGKPDGGGEVVDASLYGAVLRILEWTISAFDRLGVVREREGNIVSVSAPGGHYPTVDGTFVAIAAGSEQAFGRLCRAMSRPDLATDERFATLADRVANRSALDAIICEWTGALTAQDVERRCVDAGVAIGIAYTAADISADPHMAFRGDLVTVDDPVIGQVRQQAPYPRLSGTARSVPAGAPLLGADNNAVWCGLAGLTSAELSELRSAGVV